MKPPSGAPSLAAWDKHAWLEGPPDFPPAEADAVQLAHYLSGFVSTALSNPGAPLPAAPDGPPRYELFLPFRVASDFPRISAADIRRLSVCTAYVLISSGMLDRLIDQPQSANAESLALANTASACIHSQYAAFFSPEAPFWGYFQALSEQFIQAMQLEHQYCQAAWQGVDYAGFCRLSQGKMAMALIPPVALAFVDHTPQRIPELCQAWNEIGVAVIISDDIQDWPEDYRQGRPSFLLGQAIAACQAQGNEQPALEQIATWIVYSGILETLYACGAAHLERAVELAQQAAAPALADLARQRAVNFRRRRERFIARRMAAERGALISPAGHRVKLPFS